MSADKRNKTKRVWQNYPRSVWKYKGTSGSHTNCPWRPVDTRNCRVAGIRQKPLGVRRPVMFRVSLVQTTPGSLGIKPRHTSAARTGRVFVGVGGWDDRQTTVCVLSPLSRTWQTTICVSLLSSCEPDCCDPWHFTLMFIIHNRAANFITYLVGKQSCRKGTIAPQAHSRDSFMWKLVFIQCLSLNVVSPVLSPDGHLFFPL